MSYMIWDITSSSTARRPLAPIPRSMDLSATASTKRLSHIRRQPRKGCRHILRQKAAVRAGVGDEPFFVKAL